MFKVALSKDAKQDLKGICDFYQKISPNIKLKFITNFNLTIEQLKINPYYQIRYDSFRMRQVVKFPIVIHFIVLEKSNTVQIFGIRHAKQNPENYPKI